jgi:hypothetical protein
MEHKMTPKEWYALIRMGRSMLALRRSVYAVPKDTPERMVRIEELCILHSQAQGDIEKEVGFQKKGSWWCLGELVKLEARVNNVLELRHGWVPVDNTVRPKGYT